MFRKKGRYYTSETEYLHEQQHAPKQKPCLTKNEAKWLIAAAAIFLLFLLYMYGLSEMPAPS